MKRIVMLMPHFGTWPEWINIYLETCKHNPSIDWLFFTDCGRPENSAENVTFIEMAHDEFHRLAARRLGIALPLHPIRKLCDFRPMFGVIFDEHIRDHDYYGFGDVDVVYGNIRKFLAERIPGDYDVISFHTEMISGHFSLFRCCERVKQLFRRIEGWPDLLRDPTHLRLDEDHFSAVLDRDRTRFVEAFSTPSIYRRWKDGSWNFPTEWYWRSGTLTNDKDDAEYPYFHFLFWKGDTNPNGWYRRGPGTTIVHGDWRRARHGWRIDENGFHPLDRDPIERSRRARWARAIRARITLERARFDVRRQRWKRGRKPMSGPRRPEEAPVKRRPR